MRRLLVLSLAFAWALSLPAPAQLAGGDIMFIGYRGDGSPGDVDAGDGFAFAVLAPIPDGEVIYFTESRYTGGAFLQSEGDLTWTNTTGGVVPFGQIVIVETGSQSKGATPVANVGSVAFVGTLTWSLSQSNEEIYAYQGDIKAPTTWLAALLTDGNSTENQPPAEVISFLVDFHPTEPDADLGMYQGPGCTAKAACIADILDVASNWVLEEENGADCCDANGVDYPGDFLGALPVEWAGFDVRLSNTEARLSWSTHSETANAGFVIEHRYQSSSFVDVGFVTGAGTTDQPQTYAFQVADLVPGLHAFRLRQIDLDGTVRYSETVEVEVPTSSRLALAPVYPNPFETEATLTFAVAEDADVRLALYDVLGREVHVVFEGRVPAGESRSIRIGGHALRPGTYFARLTDSRGGVAVRSVISG